MKRRANKSNKTKKPKINSKLEGFEVKVSRFGEVQTSLEIDRINEFLDNEVEDKKLANRRKK